MPTFPRRKKARLFLAFFCPLLLAACASTGSNHSPSNLALPYLIYDPLAPNWSVEEKLLDSETYHLSMRAKSFRTGGDGEAMQILKRRGLQLQRERGYATYRILDYSEGVSSSTPFTSRYSEGTIQLVKTDAPPRP